MDSSSVDTTRPSPSLTNANKQSRGRGTAIIVYMLFLGSVLAVVTAPLGVLLAHIGRHSADPWVATHLTFQIRTFWLGFIGGLFFTAVWHALGWLGAPAMAPWAFGYLYFTACLIWMVGRCGVGISRLTSNRPVADPRSLAFGGAQATFSDP